MRAEEAPGSDVIAVREQLCHFRHGATKAFIQFFFKQNGIRGIPLTKLFSQKLAQCIYSAVHTEQDQ